MKTNDLTGKLQHRKRKKKKKEKYIALENLYVANSNVRRFNSQALAYVGVFVVFVFIIR